MKSGIVTAVEEIPGSLKEKIRESGLTFIDLSQYLCQYRTIKNYKTLLNPRITIPTEIERTARSADIVIFRTYTLVDTVMADLFRNDAFFLRAGSGYDNIDIPYVESRGGKVGNTPLANGPSAAEHTLSLMLAALKQIPLYHASVLAGEWRDALPFNHELAGKKVLVVGMGIVGRRVASLCEAFGAFPVPYDPYRDLFPGTKTNFLDAVLDADIITFHVPLTDETAGMMNGDFFAAAEKSVVIVNSSRGELFERNSLLAEIKKDKGPIIATDVYPFEPISKGDPFLAASRAVFSPHAGAYTVEAKMRLTEETMKSIEQYLAEGTVLHPVDRRFCYNGYFR